MRGEGRGGEEGGRWAREKSERSEARLKSREKETWMVDRLGVKEHRGEGTVEGQGEEREEQGWS